MKKLLLLFILFVSSSILTAQNFNQPTQFNTVCDDNNDGFSSFYLSEINFEILGNLTASDYVITHHETYSDAQTGANPLSSPYFNITPYTQTIYVRIVTVATSAVQYFTYELYTNPVPTANPYTMTVCDDNNDGIAAIDLNSTIPIFLQGSAGLVVTFHETIFDAQYGANPVFSPYYNINPQYQVLYVRVSDAATACYAVTQLYISVLTCGPTAGQPTNLTSCSDSGTAVFDLTQNDQNIIGSLNPADYTITYYTSQASADAGVAPIINSTAYSAFSNEVIYARLENNTTHTYQLFPFSLLVQAYSNDVLTLSNMEQCDDNNDSLVIFNLTNAQAQINTSNALEYFTSLTDAQNQAGAIPNPTAFTVGVQSPIFSIFVREIVANGCDVIYTFQVRAYSNCNLASNCSQANSLCNSLGVPFPNTTSFPSLGSPGCLGSSPNSTWFYLPISGAGSLNFTINQGSNAAMNNQDVDFICWGPFSSPQCTGLYDYPDGNTTIPNNIVGCSYSAATVENFTIPNALPGQYYMLMVTNFSNVSGQIMITQTNIGQLGSGAIDCAGLRLNAFLDANSNGTKDSGELDFPLGQFNYEKNNNGIMHHITAPTGVYNIYDTSNTNSYDVSYSVDATYAALYTVAPSSYANLSPVFGLGLSSYYFPVTVVQPYIDLAVNIVPINAPRPGFTYQNKILYTNSGNQTIASGSLNFNNDALVTITGNTQTGTTPTATGFTYNFTNLLPFETRELTVTMQVPTIPTVSIGGLLTNTASIAPLTGDVVPANNSSSNTQIIIGSYDPNDKMESHGEKILVSSFTSDDYLYYTIRFENSGSASAVNVRVNDVLDSKLDETSIKMISASHPYLLDRVDNNLNWKFDNIQLPVSVANTNTGKGYVMFQVKPRAGYAAGDIIPNTSSIYFDFNPAIVTNTFNTEFVTQLGVNEFENGDFVFYPNPVSDMVTISLKNNGSIANIVVYDIVGKMIISHAPTTSDSSQTIDLSAISKGVYLLEVTTDSNLKVIKKLIVE